MRPLPGPIGKYRIEARIGQGAMGAVYKAFDEDIARPVALKILHRHLVESDGTGELAARFRQEARAAARCLHCNIVTIFDYGAADDSQYIAMEFIHGSDLRSVLKQARRLPFAQAADVIRQVLRALEHAHDNGVVHRDIKPANIMLTMGGMVKVGDFGIARLDTSEITNAGVAIGTPSYMSPEAKQGMPAGAPSDIYAAAVVFFEMLTGLRPMPGRSILDGMQGDLLGAIGDPATSAETHRLLLRALDPDKDARLGSAREFVEALGAIRLPEDDADDTTIEKLLDTVIGVKLDPATAPAESTGPKTDKFSATVIERLMGGLTPYLGPMAERLVRRYAQSCTNVAELARELAAHIPDERQRARFMKEAEGAAEKSDSGKSAPPTPITGGAPSQGGGVAAPAGLRVREETLAQVVKLLAAHLGPMAPHLCKRARARAAGWEDFGAMLAAEIPNEKERAAFLKKLNSLPK